MHAGQPLMAPPKRSRSHNTATADRCSSIASRARCSPPLQQARVSGAVHLGCLVYGKRPAQHSPAQPSPPHPSPLQPSPAQRSPVQTQHSTPQHSTAQRNAACHSTWRSALATLSHLFTARVSGLPGCVRRSQLMISSSAAFRPAWQRGEEGCNAYLAEPGRWQDKGRGRPADDLLIRSIQHARRRRVGKTPERAEEPSTAGCMVGLHTSKTVKPQTHPRKPGPMCMIGGACDKLIWKTS